jgi:hypothetical protein
MNKIIKGLISILCFVAGVLFIAYGLAFAVDNHFDNYCSKYPTANACQGQ